MPVMKFNLSDRTRKLLDRSGERFNRQMALAQIQVKRGHGAPGKGLGPIVWCKTCSRKHRRRATCNMYLRTRRTSKTLREVKRWAH